MKQKAPLFFLTLFFVSVLLFQQCKKTNPPVNNNPGFSACILVRDTETVYGVADSFINCTKDAVRFCWTFGDDDTDYTDTAPIHIYATAGTFTAGLEVWNKAGDSAYTSVKVHVITLPTNFTGSYHGVETCQYAGTDSTGFSLSPGNTGGLVFSNLYRTGKQFSATFNGLSGKIPAQTYSGDSIINGSFSLLNDTIFLNLVISSFSSRDNCTGVYVKN